MRSSRPSVPRPDRFPRFALAAAVLAAALGIVLPGMSPAQAPSAPGNASTPAAREAEKAAWDESLPGPRQPIPFSHAIHAGRYAIACLYCHSGADRSQTAGMPAVKVCMGCHLQFGGDLKGVQILKKYWEQKKPIQWIQIHRLPEFVQFRHNRHVKAGITCQTCHGPVETMNKLYLVADTKWWPWLLPTKKLQMGWCIQCHRAKKVSTDCLLCHY